ncbi:ABC-2 family transporter protein [Fusobacterium nucleatum]|uniref:ABC-2 family transporter protein n=1 Tax=Fusobacterium nucleatum TaxID=851 RepID=UPI0030D17494
MIRAYLYFIILGIKINYKYSRWVLIEILSVIFRIFLIYYFWKYTFLFGIINIEEFKIISSYSLIAIVMEKSIVNLSDLIAKSIKNGNIAMDLTKPYIFLLKFTCLDIGKKIVDIFKYLSILSFIFFILKLKIYFTMNISVFILFILGFTLAIQIELIIGLLAFWTINIWGLKFLSGLMMLLASGVLIPISFYPEVIKKISNFLPFQLIIYAPVATLIGIIKNSWEIWFLIIKQIFWITLLYIVLIKLWKKIKKKILIYGG